MARPRRNEERTSRYERETLRDRSRGERRKRDDRSYDRADGSSRKGDRRGPNGRDSRRESGHQRPRRDTSSRGSHDEVFVCLLYTSPSPRDMRRSRMPSSA